MNTNIEKEELKPAFIPGDLSKLEMEDITNSINEDKLDFDKEIEKAWNKLGPSPHITKIGSIIEQMIRISYQILNKLPKNEREIAETWLLNSLSKMYKEFAIAYRESNSAKKLTDINNLISELDTFGALAIATKSVLNFDKNLLVKIFSKSLMLYSMLLKFKVSIEKRDLQTH